MFYSLSGLFNRKTRSVAKHFSLPKQRFYSWGYKRSGFFARILSLLYRNDIYRIEDGFIRSLSNFAFQYPFSICIDRTGIFYNSFTSNDLNNFIKQQLSDSELDRSKKLQMLWVRKRISKFNNIKESPTPSRPYILVVDQTKGDLSIKYGNSSERSFKLMLNWAINNWPEHLILIRAHPNVSLGKKIGYFDPKELVNERILYSNDGLSPCLQLSNCTAVCTVTSQLGFEALLWNKPTYVFGMPFYAGWGLTNDYLDAPFQRINNKVSLYQLIYAVLVKYCLYRSPYSDSNCSPENIIHWVSSNRYSLNTFNEEVITHYLTPWKFFQIKKFLPQLKFINLFNKKYVNENKFSLRWGLKHLNEAIYDNNKYLFVEDGFIRSSGLGSQLFDSSSIVIDRNTIYYDGSKTSDLENLLNNRVLSTIEIERIANIIDKIVNYNITKYNLIEKQWTPSLKNSDKKTILVVGQVPNDKSILFGVPEDSSIKDNLEMLRYCRSIYPNDWIIFKEHPDITANLRVSNYDINLIRQLCDEYIQNVNLSSIYKYVDRVCVLTSLAGFEAVLRNIPVTVFGVPFYAGWGLTNDYLSSHKWLKRRIRKIDLFTMAYITLIDYPLYYSSINKSLTSIESIIYFFSSNQKTRINLSIFQFIFSRFGFYKNIFKSSLNIE